MIYANIFLKDNRANAFEISGHAGSGPYGYDLVCAAVSAVSFGTVNAVISLCNIQPEIKQGEGGYLYVKIPLDVSDLYKDKASLLIEGMLVSLQTIEQEYGEFMKITKNAM